ncbi:Uncharacterized protein dnl_25040 [Desulfonema limicola]|uniref:Uncharacterized protein n=1 Tax=Desulfonema limicola TaxID=45656 RepID=A0A975B7W1_9BACT|nr:Uncharacterized protein dnl_25040 [Desulfonema limicola]
MLFTIEIASLLLLVALIGVLHMGMSRDDKHKNISEDNT